MCALPGSGPHLDVFAQHQPPDGEVRCGPSWQVDDQHPVDLLVVLIEHHDVCEVPVCGVLDNLLDRKALKHGAGVLAYGLARPHALQLVCSLTVSPDTARETRRLAELAQMRDTAACSRSAVSLRGSHRWGHPRLNAAQLCPQSWQRKRAHFLAGPIQQVSKQPKGTLQPAAVDRATIARRNLSRQAGWFLRLSCSVIST